MTSYISTRGPGPQKSFIDVMLAGMAPDGGLYIPDKWPTLDSRLLRSCVGLSYADIAHQVIQPFIGSALKPEVVRGLIDKAYDADRFDHPALAPLVQVGPNAWIMELFHGPTLSFKDYALQLLGQMFDHVLEERGERLTIVGATSGDTGSAAIEACRGCRNIDIFILYPHGRTSDVQRRQMTSVDAPNVHAVAIEGNFDDCQALVKAMFADEKFRNDINMSAVNSINWARIMAQIVYYVAASLALGGPDRAVSFAVPTGNFGNVFAAHAARLMGLPVHRLVIGTNRNDILARFFETGAMTVDKVMPSLSPSMDIQVSSNFERYLCGLLGGDHAQLKALMSGFSKTQAFRIDQDHLVQARQDFSSYRCSDDETLAMMRDCYRTTGYVIDPHTAVALHAATRATARDPSVPMVALSCAHPAKFPDAVKAATGMLPPVPERLAAVMDKKERFQVLPNSLDKVKAYIRKP